MTFIDKIESLTVKDYRTAFMVLSETLTTPQLVMLGLHYQSPGHDITATELSRSMGFAKFNAANRHYGGLAGKFCKFFRIAPSTKLYILVEFEQWQGEWHWIMRPKVVQALRELKWFDEPQDYIQYHNSKKTGVSCLDLDYKKGFGVSTSKSVPNLVGNRIWLIGGLGKSPKQYYLCNYFIVDEIGPAKDQRFFKYFVAGGTGVGFEPPILLNNLDWFSDFLQSQQNFHFGLRKLAREDVSRFEKLIGSDEIPADIEKQVVKTGGGFGDPETNRRVEQAAISLVKKYYQEKDWTVQSFEQQKIGYDLLCKNGLQEEHVEVKGIQGDVESFIITSAEVKQSHIDTQFVLCVVTLALSNQPQLHRHTAKDFDQKFILEPISYRAAIK